jgi:hypothetical protein
MHSLSKLIHADNGVVNEYPAMCMARNLVGLANEPVTHVCVNLNVKNTLEYLKERVPNFKSFKFGNGKFGDVEVGDIFPDNVPELNDFQFDDSEEKGRGKKKEEKGEEEKEDEEKEEEEEEEEEEEDDDDDDDSFQRGADSEHTGEGVVFPDNIQGKAVLVNPMDAYGHRPKELLSLSLYEFNASCAVLPVKPKKKDVDKVETDEAKDEEVGVHSTAGRKMNDRLPFTQGPLQTSHLIYVLSKFKIPKFYPSPPNFPLEELEDLPTAQAKKHWKMQAQTFARFSLAVYRPWHILIDEKDGVESVYFENSDGSPILASFNWIEFSKYIQFLSGTSKL